MMNLTKNQRGLKSLYFTLLALLAVFWLIPVVMMLSVSFMPPDVRSPSFGGLVMTRMSLYNYQKVFREVPVHRYFFNSLSITVPTVSLVVLFSSMAAFAFSRLTFKGRDFFFSLLLMTLMLPIPTLVIPLFQINKDLNLLNNLLGVILPYIALGVPFSVVLYRGFFIGFPKDIENAAKIDGCNSWIVYSKLVMPVSGSITSVVIIWQAMKTWNEFLLALVTIDKTSLKPLTLVPFIYNGQYMSQPGAMFAVLTLISLPIICLYVFMQRYIISGVTSGAVKG
jgi:ABC-type glycerol-3-phosphate transport system permease component